MGKKRIYIYMQRDEKSKEREEREGEREKERERERERERDRERERERLGREKECVLDGVVHIDIYAERSCPHSPLHTDPSPKHHT